VVASNQITAGQTFTFAYANNLAGALVSETYPSGRVVATNYDGGEPGERGDRESQRAANAFVSGVTYAPHGVPAFFTYRNQLARTLGYNSRLQLSSYQDALQNSPTSILFSVSPNWGAANNNGNLQGETIYEGGPGVLIYLHQSGRGAETQRTDGQKEIVTHQRTPLGFIASDGNQPLQHEAGVGAQYYPILAYRPSAC
jgi:hypothetical protein